VARYNGYLLTRTHPNDGVGNSAPISMIRETLHSDYPRLSQQAPSAFWVSRAGVQEAIDAAEALRVAELPAMLANTCQLSQELWNSSLDIREYLDGTRSYDGWDTMVMDVVMYPPDYIESQLNCLRTWADTHGLLPALAQYDCRANKMIVLQGRADEICPRLKTPDGVAPRTEEAAR
jgi:hypothetical protein